MRYYKLDGTRAVPCSMDDYLLTGMPPRGDNRVAFDTVGTVEISTVFIGIDASVNTQADPQIFETMIFGEPFSDRCWRCSTWEQALEQHRSAVALVRLHKDLGNEQG